MKVQKFVMKQRCENFRVSQRKFRISNAARNSSHRSTKDGRIFQPPMPPLWELLSLSSWNLLGYFLFVACYGLTLFLLVATILTGYGLDEFRLCYCTYLTVNIISVFFTSFLFLHMCGTCILRDLNRIVAVDMLSGHSDVQIGDYVNTK